MNLGVNTAIYNSNGVDVKNVDKVSTQILTAASKQNQQPTVQAIDYSKFNRPSLGLDLYSSRTNVELQKQVSLTQAGLYAQAVNVAKLNSQAALNLYSAATVQKQVELTQSIQGANDLEAPKKLEDNKRTIELFNILDKNSNSSNGFNPFSSAEEKTTEEEKSESKQNIALFA